MPHRIRRAGADRPNRGNPAAADNQNLAGDCGMGKAASGGSYMKVFTAAVRKAGINPYVLVPKPVSTSFGVHGNIPVRASINGKRFRATLTPRGGGRHKLYLNLAMRIATGRKVGDTVRVSLTLDRQPRTLPVPAALRQALRQHPRAKKAWNQSTPSRRKHVLAYLNYLKSKEALERNVEKVIRLLGKW